MKSTEKSKTQFKSFYQFIPNDVTLTAHEQVDWSVSPTFSSPCVHAVAECHNIGSRKSETDPKDVKNVGAIIDAGRQSMLPWKVSRCLVRWLFISSSTACLQHGVEAAASALKSVNRWGESSLPWCTTNLSELHIMVTTPTSSVDCSFLPAVRIQNKKSTRD